MSQIEPIGPLASPSVGPSAPIIDRLFNFRGMVAAAFFGIVIYALTMIKDNPAFLKDSSFMGVVMLLVGTGGLGLVGQFAFGGTKTGSETMANQSAAVIKQAVANPPIDSTTTTTTKTVP